MPEARACLNPLIAVTPTPHHATALGRWLDLAGDDARGVVACRVTHPQTIAPRIRAVPWHLAWTPRVPPTG